MDKALLEKKINKFIGWAGKQAELIQKLNVGETPEGEIDPSRLYKQLAYMSVIDVLSKVVCPKEITKSNRKRVMHFLEEFTGWQETDRVSLPHLVKLLEIEQTQHNNSTFETLRNYAFSEFKSWSEERTIEHDLSIDQVKQDWPLENGKPIKINSLDYTHLQHKNLFYELRNLLVHEARSPGPNFTEDDEEVPVYHSVIGDPYSFAYPTGFLHKILTKGIEQVRKHCLEKKINPYQCFTFGSYWLTKLNAHTE